MVNIDEYSIAYIKRLVDKKSTSKDSVLFNYEFEKFAIVDNKVKKQILYPYRNYKLDILTNEKYYLDSDDSDELNTLYISLNKYIPLNQIIDTDKKNMKKKEFFKLCREYIIELNNKNLNNNQKNIINKINNKSNINIKRNKLIDVYDYYLVNINRICDKKLVDSNVVSYDCKFLKTTIVKSCKGNKFSLGKRQFKDIFTNEKYYFFPIYMREGDLVVDINKRVIPVTQLIKFDGPCMPYMEEREFLNTCKNYLKNLNEQEKQKVK